MITCKLCAGDIFCLELVAPALGARAPGLCPSCPPYCYTTIWKSDSTTENVATLNSGDNFGYF